MKDLRKNASTIARIAGNLLSGRNGDSILVNRDIAIAHAFYIMETVEQILDQRDELAKDDELLLRRTKEG